jgi:hypothetical protein
VCFRERSGRSVVTSAHSRAGWGAPAHGRGGSAGSVVIAAPPGSAHRARRRAVPVVAPPTTGRLRAGRARERGSRTTCRVHVRLRAGAGVAGETDRGRGGLSRWMSTPGRDPTQPGRWSRGSWSEASTAALGPVHTPRATSSGSRASRGAPRCGVGRVRGSGDPACGLSRDRGSRDVDGRRQAQQPGAPAPPAGLEGGADRREGEPGVGHSERRAGPSWRRLHRHGRSGTGPPVRGPSSARRRAPTVPGSCGGAPRAPPRSVTDRCVARRCPCEVSWPSTAPPGRVATSSHPSSAPSPWQRCAGRGD